MTNRLLIQLPILPEAMLYREFQRAVKSPKHVAGTIGDSDRNAVSARHSTRHNLQQPLVHVVLQSCNCNLLKMSVLILALLVNWFKLC